MRCFRRWTEWLLGIGAVCALYAAIRPEAIQSSRGSYRASVALHFPRDIDGTIERYALVRSAESAALLANPQELEGKWQSAPEPGSTITVSVMGAFSSDPTVLGRHMVRHPYADTALFEFRNRAGENATFVVPIRWNAAKTDGVVTVAPAPSP